MIRDQDTTLVTRCLGGERGAFDALVEKYERKLYNVAYRITGDAEDAMDATQGAFVKAYEKLDTFDDSYRFFSWLYRIALNESINIVNRRKKQSQYESNISTREHNPEEAYHASETDRRLQHAMMELKTDYRVVLVLKHFHGFSYRELSETLGIPEKTVKSRLFSARQQLKDVLVTRGMLD